MKKKIFCLLTAFLLLFIQTHPYLPFGRGGIRPDLFFVLAVYVGVNSSLLTGSFICFFLGYGMEVFSGTNTGLYSTIYLSVFLVIKMLLKYFSFDGLIKLIFLLFVCFFIRFVIIFFSFYFIYEYDYSVFKNIFLLESFYTLILSPFVFLLLIKAEGYQKDGPYFWGSKKNVS